MSMCIQTPFLHQIRRPSLSKSQQHRSTRMLPVHTMAAPGATSAVDLKKGIAEFYDEASRVWENVWGDHMHHGFYDAHVQASISDHRSAQIRMIEQALAFAGVPGLYLSLSLLNLTISDFILLSPYILQFCYPLLLFFFIIYFVCFAYLYGSLILFFYFHMG